MCFLAVDKCVLLGGLTHSDEVTSTPEARKISYPSFLMIYANRFAKTQPSARFVSQILLMISGYTKILLFQRFGSVVRKIVVKRKIPALNCWRRPYEVRAFAFGIFTSINLVKHAFANVPVTVLGEKEEEEEEEEEALTKKCSTKISPSHSSSLAP